MAGLDPAIQRNKGSFGARTRADWMAASKAAMTNNNPIQNGCYSLNVFPRRTENVEACDW